MAGLERPKTIVELRRLFGKVKSGWSQDTRFMASAAMFNSERIERMAVALERLVAQGAPVKRRRRPVSEYQRFFGEGMRAGKTPAEIGAEWRRRS